MMRKHFDPRQVGWKIGKALHSRLRELWCPWDRTAGVIGPQGSGKTLDVLIPALLAAPGAALVTLTKPDDLLLSWAERTKDGRPAVVLDPFGQLAGALTELVWDPVAGCSDPMTAERRAKAFTMKLAGSNGAGDTAARFYAGEAAKVLQAYLHAASLAGKSIDTIVRWAAQPRLADEPAEILRTHPAAAPHWHALLVSAIHGDEKTSANTSTTVHQALALFFQPEIRNRCTPSTARPATNIADVIRRDGTVYLLGREDPYASAAPLMTALAEHVLDTALLLANESRYGRLCPPMLACLDELPSTAPLPTLLTRMANDRALGISYIWAAQTRRQLAALWGEAEARALMALTNVLILFGGSKDVEFNKEISDMLGQFRVARTNWQHGSARSASSHGEDIAIITGEEFRRLPDKQAIVIAEAARPIIAELIRCVEGKAGAALKAQREELREKVANKRRGTVSAQARAVAAVARAKRVEA
jgi:type IV secretion system protein VirD4